MSSAAKKLDYELSEPGVSFIATLEDGSSFSASLTELKSSTTPGRGDVWVVVATERKNGAPRTFTITFSKNVEETEGEITDNDTDTGLFFNDYKDLHDPTLQKARAGTIKYKLDTFTQNFNGSFVASIDKADGSGTYECLGQFNTLLSR